MYPCPDCGITTLHPINDPCLSVTRHDLYALTGPMLDDWRPVTCSHWKTCRHAACREARADYQPADPAAYAELERAVAGRLYDQRHADADRWAEACAAVATIHLHAACPGRCAERMTREAERWQTFTRYTRENRAADYCGTPQPETYPA